MRAGPGDTDVLSASFGGGRIAWYENIDGRGTLRHRHTITNTASGATSVYAIDLDGDGDVDVLSASEKDDKIAWYENTDGLGGFGPQQIISTAADEARSVFAADLDGDGDIDVLSASYGDDKIAWYENTDGLGTFGPQRIITIELMRANSVFAADLDGDGDTDVISASTGDTGVAWYENTDGLGTFGPPQAINTTSHAVSLYATDVDGDGDTDILSAGGGTHWYENTDGLGSFGQQRTINTGRSGSVFASDLDGDGDSDVVSVSSRGDRLAWYDNTDGLGAFGPQQLLTTDTRPSHLNFTQSVFAADVDGDGDVDVLWASERDGKIAWYENSGFIPDCNYNQVPDECDINGGSSTDCNGNAIPDDCELGREFPPQVIAQAGDQAKAIFCADLDGDGDIDVLSASAIFQGAVTWHRNTDGLGTFGPRLAIATNILGAYSVFAADLDGDGDTDVLSGSIFDIVWIENIDGLGTFGTKRLVATISGYGGVLIFAADLDGDGDLDVLSASDRGTMVAWYENTDGLGTFGRRRIINTLFGGSSVFAADLDGDGDIDVLSGSSWFENTDGRGNFGPRLVIHATATGALSVFAADVDGDGDNDVVSTSGWYENTDGLGTFGPLQEIGLPSDLVSSIIVADMDGDGDGDVLSASFHADKIGWYENTDGLGTFGRQQIIGVADGPWAIFPADLDGDGDLDILSSSQFDDKIRWHENTGYSRDCNDNHMPDVCDIADGISTDCNASDIPDECEPFGIEDVDGDGVVELCDSCPDSRIDRTLIVSGCDTGVVEYVFDSGCTMADLLDECNGDGRTHGDYVSCVTDVANEWIRESVITGREFGRVVSCAAKPQSTTRRTLRHDDGGRK